MDHTHSHPATWTEGELLEACTVRRQRRSGPGGQHRNKVETAVVIQHNPTGVCGQASERRSQDENLRRAVLRLRVSLAVEVRTSVELSTFNPSDLWLSRCRDGKLSVSSQHDDFPAILAEALDVVATCADDAKSAAEYLGCTASQLIKLLQQEPRVITALNSRRRVAGKSPYR